MSDEPVAKRTRLSASHSKNERAKRIGELQRERREMYEDGMSSFNVGSKAVIHMSLQMNNNRKGLMTQECIGICKDKCKCDCRREQFQMEHELRKLWNAMQYNQRKLFDIKCLLDHMTFEELHAHNCRESDECLLKMQRFLIQDPLSLERKQFVHTRNLTTNNVAHRCSPLHDAVREGHVKCVKFLLKRGANVNSVTTVENNSILHTLYDPCIFHVDDQKRFNILKLLLKYGVSSMFQHKKSGEFALVMLCIRPTIMDEVLLLLQHGAIMDRKESRTAIVEAWERFDLPLIKLLLLHHQNRLNFGPGSHALCKQLIPHCYQKMVLPGVPLDLCHEKMLEALEFYKAFGGKFHVCPNKNDPDQDLMQYLECYKHKQHFDGARLRIKEIISNPLSLQEISRLVIRKSIHKDYIENVEKLGVPKALQSFLRFDDVIITKLPDDFDGDYSSYSGSSEDEDSSSDVEL